jgi:uncharacterized protein YabN with tetrapyrrole methylase and pyrophosphatase domain
MKALRSADRVLYVVDHPSAERWIQSLNPSHESLRQPAMTSEQRRVEMYDAMAARAMDLVREGQGVCLAFYGHPGILVAPAHRALAMARAEGFPTRLLPGVSALDCLFADLAFDPASHGLQSHDATAFLIYGKVPDPTCHLVLWQIGLVGDPYYQSFHRGGLSLLVETLCGSYDAGHPVVVYEAAVETEEEPRVQRLRLGDLAGAAITPFSMLYIPPAAQAPTHIPHAIRLMEARLRSD